MRKHLSAIALLAAVSSLVCGARTAPSSVHTFAVRDGIEMRLSIFEPDEGSIREIDGKQKPTILFAFGGGFKEGERDGDWNVAWYDLLNRNGYRAVSFDYRLGLKDTQGAGVNPAFAKELLGAIQMAVEDLFDATLYLIENSAALGIDPSNIVVSGSSAGAITALQAEWEICNGTALAAVMPSDFNYAGVMSFSGAIYSTQGKIRFQGASCPIFLCHGTDDKIVPYGQFALLGHRFAGTKVIAKALEKEGADYNVLRFDERSHEIAASMAVNLPMEIEFLEQNVCKGVRRKVDALIDDDAISRPSWGKGDYKNLYKKK